MKKITLGLLGIFLVIGIVAGVGFALFSSTATMSGMVLGTATPGLKIAFYDKSTDKPDTYYGYRENLNFSGAGQSFQKLLPGEYDWGAFFLKNDSIDGNPNPEVIYQERLDFSLQGRISSVNVNADWDLLKSVIRMQVCVVDTNADNFCHATLNTDFYTLNQWYGSAIDLPGEYLLSGEERPYVVVFHIPSGYGNNIAGKTITGMTMQVTGTQVLE